jgi:translation initiation factor 1 (eIF-1/SUI1)
MFYNMSYRLERTEDDAEVKKAVNEAQEYYDAQEKREWVEWAGKVLMPRLHVQIAMEKADAARAEQEEAEEMRQQVERAQREQEQVAKEVELDGKEVEYIRQVNTKEIYKGNLTDLRRELHLSLACKGNLTDLRRILHLSLAKGNPK